jgi:hypothetical protein
VLVFAQAMRCRSADRKIFMQLSSIRDRNDSICPITEPAKALA